MKSEVLPEFWTEYRKLPQPIRQRARKAYRLWASNSAHPSLRFKCINQSEDLWSVRITKGYRAIAFKTDDVYTWFWIGNHDDYERFFASVIVCDRELKVSAKYQTIKNLLRSSAVFATLSLNCSF